MRLFVAGIIDPKKRRTTEVLNNMFWGDGQQQRGFLHQVGDVIEHVFRPTAKRQEMLLQEIITKLDRENSNPTKKSIGKRREH
jgi:hypothetical protein